MDDYPLEGQSAIITGASRGIGESIALALGNEKMRLGLIARSVDRLAKISESVEKAGGKAIAVQCDLSDPVALDDGFDRVVRELGNIDALVCNAGTFLEKSITEIRLDEWERVIRLNLTAPFLLYRKVFPVMARQGGGKIVNILSKAALQGYDYQGAYSASKHGLLGLARCLALEGSAQKIHVYNICPGAVRTDLLKGTYLERRTEGKTLIEPADIAKVVAFLLKQGDHIDIPEIVIRRFGGN